MLLSSVQVKQASKNGCNHMTLSGFQNVCVFKNDVVFLYDITKGRVCLIYFLMPFRIKHFLYDHFGVVTKFLFKKYYKPSENKCFDDVQYYKI